MNARCAFERSILCRLFACAAFLICSCVEGKDLKEEFRKAQEQMAGASLTGSFAEEFPSSENTQEDYVRYALVNSPEMQAAFERWSSFMSAVDMSGYLDNPEVIIEKTLDEVDLDYRIGLAQAVPWYGKRSLEKRIAEQNAEAAMHTFMAIKSEVYMQVVTSFSEYRYLASVISVADENLELLVDMERVVQANYEAGEAQFSDLTKVQVERDKLQNELSTFTDMRSVRSSQLAALIGADPRKVLPWPSFDERDLVTLPEELLFELLDELNPEMKAMASIKERDRLSEALASKYKYPDFRIGVGFMVMPENDAGEQMTDGSLSLGIKLPVWRGKYKAAERSAAARHRATSAGLAKLEDELRVELRAAIFKTRDAQRKIQLFKDSLIPKGEQALKVAMRDYSAGKVGFMTLIDAQRTLLEFKIMYQRALADMEMAIAEIGCCVGKYETPRELIESAGIQQKIK